MHTGLEEEKGGFDKLAAFYGERAWGGVGLIVTGGIAPNLRGRLVPHGSQLSFPWQVAKHKKVTSAVHQEGGKIALQILHAGRYAYHPFSLAPSALKAPIFSVQAARHERAPDPRHHPRLRRHRATGQERGLRRGGGDGVGRVSHQPVHLRAHQQAHRWLGWQQ